MFFRLNALSLHCKAVRDILELQMQSVGNVSHTFLDLVILMVPCNGSNEVLCSFFFCIEWKRR